MYRKIADQLITHHWTQKTWVAFALWPFSLIYQGIATVRRCWQSRFQHRRQSLHAAYVIVVGNLTVGGTGKTPIVTAITAYCQRRGIAVGIVSRGYKGSLKGPHLVTPEDSPATVGDEPFLLATTCHCPVVIGADRVKAVQYLLQKTKVDLIISDDGLQHYRLDRQWELLLIDGMTGLGNGFCLPAGPLREGKGRFRRLDLNVTAVLINGEPTHASLHALTDYFRFSLVPQRIQRVKTKEPVAIETLPKSIAAITGIGNPKRFFDTVKSLGFDAQQHVFPDHHPFCLHDFETVDLPVLMTSKDAVKCANFAKDDWYFLTVEASLPAAFWPLFEKKLAPILTADEFSARPKGTMLRTGLSSGRVPGVNDQ